ncbi:PepSY domain-containing protein [Sedimenticola hydrogenitrophicus]|uniref:PepSY domain-containing protein n=1 Tax=Sedimenticola hydrogenitrophicus TaxID=2967975 RepID=UPI0021A471EB|nr:PepSY domain-containing protein [Sedimenticola hydrogenitrophicus]
MKRHYLLLVALLVPLLVMAERDHERARALLESGEILSLEQILANVRAEYPGRPLEVKLEQKKGALIYEIELLDDDGKVWELKLDAVTGELLKRERED